MKLSVNGISYHVEVCGSGFPLIMLHGFTGRGSNWNPYCSNLGGKSKLIMPDIIGHGLTDSPEEIEKYQMESVARDFIDLINQLGYEKVDIVGYSMGGRLALAITVLFPDKVRKLILESSSPGLKAENARMERQSSDLKLANFINENGMEAFVDYWENIPLFQSQKLLPENTKSLIRSQRLANRPIGLAKSLIGMGTGSQPSYWDRLHEIKADVLMIVGENDHKFCKIAFEMKKHLKNGAINKVENAGHAIHVEQPEKFGTIVSEFLSNKADAP